jgi:sialate O-acetylesterase
VTSLAKHGSSVPDLRRPTLVLALCLLASAATTAGAVPRPRPALLHPLFQDHAVLQRDRPIEIWGNATAGSAVVASLAGREVGVRADAAGRWAATLPALPGGGPFTLQVSAASGETAVAEDVLLGDVFLCSGQSNMQLPVRRTLNSDAEIASAANDGLRMLVVGPAARLTPAERFLGPVEWQVAAPETVPEWSATCYYFGRELQKAIDEPIGMIAASWGGSGIRSWMSEAALRAVGDHDDDLDLLRLFAVDRAAAMRRWGERWQDWWRSRTPGDEPWGEPAGDDRPWAVAPDGLGPWEGWGVPGLGEFDGMLWYRTAVRLSASQAARPAVLSLGRIDEIDQTWVNGRPVGNGSGPGEERLYPLPAGLLRAGENRVVVNVLDTWGSGGLVGAAEPRGLRLSGGEVIPLAGEWRYRVVPAAIGLPPRAPWDATGGVTTIFNAMIAPLGRYGRRGAVWYQGESDTGDAGRYGDLLAALMADWRERFGADLAFLIVQLANWGAPPTQPTGSGWAELREAQRLIAAGDERAGLAVTIDIGDRYDIHPANKQEVGRRLARVARQVVYGEPIAPSGPVPLWAKLEDGRVVIEFGGIEGGLVAYGADGPIGFELCGADAGSCRFAVARIAGARVSLDAAGPMTPTRVRFCWADRPICTLFDRSGLPAGPFELRIEQARQGGWRDSTVSPAALPASLPGSTCWAGW